MSVASAVSELALKPAIPRPLGRGEELLVQSSARGGHVCRHLRVPHESCIRVPRVIRKANLGPVGKTEAVRGSFDDKFRRGLVNHARLGGHREFKTSNARNECPHAVERLSQYQLRDKEVEMIGRCQEHRLFLLVRSHVLAL